MLAGVTTFAAALTSREWGPLVLQALLNTPLDHALEGPVLPLPTVADGWELRLVAAGFACSRTAEITRAAPVVDSAKFLSSVLDFFGCAWHVDLKIGCPRLRENVSCADGRRNLFFEAVWM